MNTPTRTPRLSRSAILALAEALAQRQPIRSVVRLQRIARREALASGGQLTPDDVIGQMVVMLVERAGELADQTEAYVLRRCSWEAKHCAEAGRTYGRYCPPMPAVSDDEGREIDLVELWPDSSPGPEELLVTQETLAERRALLARLRPRLNRAGARVFDGLLSGRRLSEIADQHGLSRAAITHGLHLIRRAAERCDRQAMLPGLGD